MKLNYLSEEERASFTPYKRIENGKEAIFIHIPKTAGTSIRQTLAFPRPLDSNFRFKKHYRLKEVEEQLGPNCLKSAFIFAFVRNPWDRLYSAYLFRRRKILKGKAPPSEVEGRDNINDFETWVRFLSKREVPLRGTITEPQLSWITNSKGEIQVDYLARYENLEEDYTEICQIMGVEVKPLLKVNVSKRERNYHTVYNDYLHGFVAEHYKDDIEYLKYNF